MDKEQTAIARLREASSMSLKVYKQPLVVTTSGGKDSSVCTALAERAGIPFEVMHNHTTADAPETVYFVRDELRRLELKGVKCVVNYPAYKGRRTSMWQLIPQKLMPPTRLVRYCCAILKERGGAGRFITTGVRWEESPSRRENRGIYEAGRKVQVAGKKGMQSDYRMDGCGCMGLHRERTSAAQSSVSMRIFPRWMYRMPDGGNEGPSKGVCPLSQIPA